MAGWQSGYAAACKATPIHSGPEHHLAILSCPKISRFEVFMTIRIESVTQIDGFGPRKYR
jgi:hypothetical protein